MKVEDINTAAQASYYVEGVINDFESGILTKDETLKCLGEYTGRLMELFWDTAKDKIRRNPQLLNK